jgi:hypothetical protein
VESCFEGCVVMPRVAVLLLASVLAVAACAQDTASLTPPEERIPPGLSCSDLRLVAMHYPQAVAYFFAEGFPARMDADGDGIPCE